MKSKVNSEICQVMSFSKFYIFKAFFYLKTFLNILKIQGRDQVGGPLRFPLVDLTFIKNPIVANLNLAKFDKNRFALGFTHRI